MGGYLKRHHLALEKYWIVQELPLERYQDTAFGWLSILCQISEQILTVFERYESVSIFIIVRPALNEIIYALLLDRDLCKFCLPEKRVDNDRDEEVEEDLGDDHLEEDVKDNREAISATFRPKHIIWIIATSNDAVVILVLFALVHDREGLR